MDTRTKSLLFCLALIHAIQAQDQSGKYCKEYLYFLDKHSKIIFGFFFFFLISQVL